jgi:hypothetical protein
MIPPASAKAILIAKQWLPGRPFVVAECDSAREHGVASWTRNPFPCAAGVE